MKDLSFIFNVFVSFCFIAMAFFALWEGKMDYFFLSFICFYLNEIEYNNRNQ